MATQWVLDKVNDYIQPTIHSTVSSAGSYAGGAISSVGNSINGVGTSINSTVRRYGDGVIDYANGVMDWSSADAVRGQTASNPLGLSSGRSGGRRAVTSPSIYSAPAKSKPSTTASNRTAPAKKAVQSSTKPNTSAPKAGKATTLPAVTSKKSTPNPGAMKKAGAGSGSATKTAKPVKPVKASTAKATQAKPPSTQSRPYTAAASNPLGLSS